jgi:hypothetical protein
VARSAKPREIRLPPFCGDGLNAPFLYNPYQAALLDARRQRVCPECGVIGPVDKYGIFHCASCAHRSDSQLYAYKAFHRIGIVGGRRSGKTRVGAHAAREETIVPGGLGWICGPTFKMLHDSTLPAFFRLIPPSWVKHWAPQQMELTLVNGHMIQIRSLDDVERGRGPGPLWIWVDEAQKIKEKAWDVLRPALTDTRGNALFSFTPNGFDWTWRRLWKLAHGPFRGTEQPEPGFWMAKCKTIDNPWIQRYGMDEVDEARRTMPAAMFRQEYEADFVSFVGNVYDWADIEPLVLHEDGLKHFIPEWPAIDPSRTCVIGLSAKPGHPVGAVLLVLTEYGIVVAKEYTDEHRALAYHFDALTDGKDSFEGFLPIRDHDRAIVGHLTARWAYSEEETAIHTEATRRREPLPVIPTEPYLINGIQRVQSWMYFRQLWFADSCIKTLDQMQGYRWSDASSDDDEPNGDRVLEKNVELPNAIRHGLLSWPSLPSSPEKANGRDLSRVPERVRTEIQAMAEYENGADRSEDIAATDAAWLNELYGGGSVDLLSQ